jgi:serine/threonine protein phosphatase 1
MFRRRFKAELEPEEPLYVIGDVHGMNDLLLRILAKIKEDAARHNIENPRIILVGDYTDRGHDSRAVIDHLIALKRELGDRLITLMGNHDEYILKFLDRPTRQRRWLNLGGTDTLYSFGLQLAEDAPDDELEVTSTRFKRALGHDRKKFLENLQLSFQSGNIFIAHAGADPAVPIAKQTPKTLLWIREMKKPRKDGIWVVHGHTVQNEANIKDGRIAIDTGAFFSNRLTAVRITKGQASFIDTAT